MSNYLKSNLKFLREQKGLSQTKLAKKIGVNQTTIGRWESGEITPTVDNVVDLLKALNIPIESLGEFLGKDLRLNNDNTQKATFENNEMKVTIWKDGEITNDDLDDAMAFILEQKKKKKENDKENEKR